MRILPEADWLMLEAQQRKIVEPIIHDFQYRRQRRIKHPVYDFLFKYYQTNRHQLLDWRPGYGIIVQGEQTRRFLKNTQYRKSTKGVFLDTQKIDSKLKSRITWIHHLITATTKRTPRFTCFGLHEWAMVYKAKQIRHESTPLRLPKAEIDHLVESNEIRCTHFDAFRFFTPEAIPLNQIAPTHETRFENEQFGCLHFNMDLYKWCYKLSPWTSSDLTIRCFQLAIEARELDMRASPYDVSAYDLLPIPVETSKGRKLYQIKQEAITNQGLTLAKDLLNELESIQNGAF